MKSLKDIFWYLESVGGKELFEFGTHKEAIQFGAALREIESDKVEVQINLTTVRVKLMEQECLK